MMLIRNWIGTLRGNKAQHRSTTRDPLLDRPLLWFGKNDAWRVRDACEGTAVFGATGSGKTSGSGQGIAKALLRAGCGGLVCCAKPGEAQLWRQYCQETNRSDSLIIFSPTERWRLNFLNYE